MRSRRRKRGRKKKTRKRGGHPSLERAMSLILREGPFCSKAPDTDEADRIQTIILEKTIDYMKRNKRRVVDLIHKLDADTKKDPELGKEIRRVLRGCQAGGRRFGEEITRQQLIDLAHMAHEEATDAHNWEPETVGSIVSQKLYEFMLFIIFSIMVEAALNFVEIEGTPRTTVMMITGTLFAQFLAEADDDDDA